MDDRRRQAQASETVLADGEASTNQPVGPESENLGLAANAKSRSMSHWHVCNDSTDITSVDFAKDGADEDIGAMSGAVIACTFHHFTTRQRARPMRKGQVRVMFPGMSNRRE